jgi:hypothetical protein
MVAEKTGLPEPVERYWCRRNSHQENSMAYSSGKFSVDEIGFIQLADTDVLAAVARGEIDLNRIAREELASRGLDHFGKWIGFQEAKRLLNQPAG